MPSFTVTCQVSYTRTWSNIEADSEEDAIREVLDNDPECDDFPGACDDVDGWDATEEEKTENA